MLVERVGQIDAEALSRCEEQPGLPAIGGETEDPGRAAVHLEGAGAGQQAMPARGRGRGLTGLRGNPWNGTGGTGGGKKKATCQAGGHWRYSWLGSAFGGGSDMGPSIVGRSTRNLLGQMVRVKGAGFRISHI
ncbi:hypothetical protein Apmu_0067_07 [Acidiphilium multivorum AIU301]|nr:hypothetical protein Apmu_0067_07 [Acidiphilium multivorum AIU301]